MRPLFSGFIAAAIFCAGSASADVNSPGTDHSAKIDALFAPYANRPGCAVGVMRDGRVVHAAGYGLADVERRVPITPATLFDIASTSKQFAAAAVILLELDGKLALSDDVRKYVPELRDYGTPITIDHLLRHTSGLRDYVALLSLAGIDVHDVSGDEQALAIVARQAKLNFPTGSRYEYSNSGYFLLSVIVERVSGKPLAEFARERLFAPLGMTQARFRDNYALVIPGRALGYAASGASPQGEVQFSNAASDWEHTGDGALFLSVEDAFKWAENFHQPRVGGQALIDRLQQTGHLANGEPIGYARGLFVDEYRGLRRIQHAGNWIGFNAMLARYPQQHTSIAIFCNFEGAEAAGLADNVADIVLADVLKPATAPAKTKAAGSPVASAPLARFVGSYYAESSDQIFTVKEEKGALAIYMGPMALPLVATGPASFAVTGYPVTVTFATSGKKSAHALEFVVHGEDVTPAKKYSPATPGAAELQAYAGTFYSQELDVTWPVVVEEGRLVVRSEPRKFVPKSEPLEPAMADAFSGESGFVRFTRNASGKVTGFDLSSSRMRGIHFESREPR